MADSAKQVREDVDVALESWARWAKNVLSQLGYPAMSIIGRIVKYGVRGAADRAHIQLVEADELCEMVDRAVLRLSERERQVVAAEYFTHKAQYLKAQDVGVSPTRFNQLLKSARRSVEDFLEGAKEQLEY